MKTQLRPSQKCTLLASLPRSKLCLKNCAGGVHDQLWQKMSVETNIEFARVDYPGNVGENDSALPFDPDFRALAFSLRSWACGAAGSALPWHGRGRRFDPDQVHQFPQHFLAQPPVVIKVSLLQADGALMVSPFQSLNPGRRAEPREEST